MLADMHREVTPYYRTICRFLKVDLTSEKTCVPFFLHYADPCDDCLPFWVASAEYVKEAVAEDNAGNYQKAFDLYKIALEYFSTHLKYEKNPRAKEAITAKVYTCDN